MLHPVLQFARKKEPTPYFTGNKFLIFFFGSFFGSLNAVNKIILSLYHSRWNNLVLQYYNTYLNNDDYNKKDIYGTY